MGDTIALRNTSCVGAATIVGDDVVAASAGTVGIGGEVGSDFRQMIGEIVRAVMPAETRGSSPIEAAALGAVCSAALGAVCSTVLADDDPLMLVRFDDDPPAPLIASDSETPRSTIDGAAGDAVLATFGGDAGDAVAAPRVGNAERMIIGVEPALDARASGVTAGAGRPTELAAGSDFRSAVRCNAAVGAAPATTRA